MTPESPVTQPESEEQKDIRLNKDIAAFSYIWVMSFVVYAAKKDSKFARHHSKQAMILCLASFVWVVPFIGQFISIFVVAGMVLGFIHAAQGSYADVPIVGPLSRGTLDLHGLAEGILKVFSSIIDVCKSLLKKTTNTSEKKEEHVDNPIPPQVP